MHDITRGELRAPATVLDIDIEHDYRDEAVDVGRFETAWCLVRRNGVPVAMRFLDIKADASVALAEVRDRFAEPSLPQPVEATPVPDISITVAICTRDRREGLLRTLASLARLSDTDFEVLVVDNSSEGEVARTLTEFEGLAIRCTHEPVPGLARARNRALSRVRTEFVVFVDDDEVFDRDWMAWIKRGFCSPDRPDVVSGLILPAELETTAQVDFERYGGHNKGRGIEPVRLRAGTPSVFDPLYPLPNFGAGGNMAFRVEALRRIGGFDNRLGAGTLVHGGEETRAFSQLLEIGSTILYWPPALAWHPHHRTDEALEQQFYQYSAGLTAFYMSMIVSSPKYVWRILGFVPRGVRRMVDDRRSSGQGDTPAGYPPHLLRAGRKGIFTGAWLYLREIQRQRRLDRAA
jgi:GT2 family glycosyltransferase